MWSQSEHSAVARRGSESTMDRAVQPAPHHRGRPARPVSSCLVDLVAPIHVLIPPDAENSPMRIRLLGLLAPMALIACTGAEPARPGLPGKYDWPQWRGPDRTHVSKETGLLQEWPKSGPKLAWRVEGVGEGFSTPSIAAGRVYVMGNVDGKECVLALSEKDGDKIWSTPIGPATEAGGFQ